ncbi:arylsulfatase [Congregibacter sp.]|uniref:arylsulfatase n=1 Tax=Congregibacter sp. TaxID=2744308 RepID=UPI0039E452DE
MPLRRSRGLTQIALGTLALMFFCQPGLAGDVGSAIEEALLQPAKASPTRPNVVLILADDLGFSDLAPYGGEINTPTLSALAAAGVSFSNYHTAASCAPSRAMLLTGVDSHRAGVPNIPEMIPPDQRQQAHYQGVLGRNVVTIASLLQDSGYHTYMAGKWHLGMTPDLLPYSRGFERTVSMADSGADNWEQKPYLPIYEKANWFADGQAFSLPENFYSSRFLIDKTIEFIDSNADDEQPFFAYVPFQAVHMPVQAPQEFIDRYMGVYDQGWEVLRHERHERAKDLGVIPAESTMVTMSTTEDWDELSQAEKRYQAKRMAVYAAMVEAMDHHLGRLVKHLKANGQYDNTVFIFTSDNGSEASGSVDPDNAATRFVLARQGYTNEYDTLGLKGSFNSLPPSFSSASVSPLAFYKFYSGEGGMRVPLIVAGAGIDQKPGFSKAFAYVTDIAPTVLELTGTALPGSRYGGRLVEPMIGRTLLPLLRGDVGRVHADHEAIGYELAGNAALFQGDYKIVINRGPLGDNQWHLFNIVTDPGETQDLAGKMPTRFQHMLSLYQSYVKDNGVLPVSSNYNDRRQVAINGLQDRFGRQILLALLSLVVLLPFLIVYRLRYRR